MENDVKLPLPRLFTLGDDVANGLATHGAAVGIARNTEPVVRVDLEAAELERDNYEAGAQTLRDRIGEARAVTAAARQFARLTRDVLIPTLGSRYSAAWNQTGLIGSLEIPRNRESVQGVLQSCRSYLANNPVREVADTVTAALAEQHLDAISAARTAVQLQKTTVKNLKLARDAKVVLLQKRLRLFMAELGEKISSTDPLWLSFGLNQPGIRARPDAPINLTAMLIGSNSVSVKWHKAARAEYYRVWKRVVGSEAEFLPVGSPADLDFLIEGLPTNATVEIVVAAVNNGGTSVWSEILTVQMA